MTIRKLLLGCGIMAPALFIATDLAASTLFYPGYDYTAQQVSELSAIGAPSRTFWMLMGMPYALLGLAFAVGVWLTANGRLALRIAAVFVAVFIINGFLWGNLAPMHMRGTEFTTTDTLHIAFVFPAIASVVGFVGFGAAAFGWSFRIYSALTVGAMLAAGAIVGTQVQAIAAGEPTPWLGLVERIAVHGPMVWLAVFAIALLKGDARQAGRRPAAA